MTTAELEGPAFRGSWNASSSWRMLSLFSGIKAREEEEEEEKEEKEKEEEKEEEKDRIFSFYTIQTC